MKITVLGTGYVGLVTGACLADMGHEVVCVDKQADRIDAVNAGRPPFHEPGLEAVIAAARAAGRLSGTTDLAAALQGSAVSIIAVGTPSVDGRIDLSDVEAAGRAIGALLPGLGGYHTVVLKSTCVPGTTDSLLRAALETASGMVLGQFGLCMNPEFLREGCAVADFRNSDRIVIGAADAASADVLGRVYQDFTCPKLVTTPRNAEMIKYASNALLATLISFSNEIAGLCEAVPGLDEAVVMEGLHLDRRLSPIHAGERVRPDMLSYLRGGIGYGGSCFPKDTQALRAFARDRGVTARMLDAVIETNNARTAAILDLLTAAVPSLGGARIAVLGLSFKPDTDDVRESPGVRLASALLERGAQVVGWDPMAHDVSLPGAFTRVGQVEEAMAGADAAIIATAWPELKNLDWARVLAAARRPVLLDGRRLLNPSSLPDGTVYLTIGRQP